MSRYDDRLDPQKYQNDEPVGAGPAHGPESCEGWVWIPERLFDRVRLIAAGYGLHVLPGVDMNDRNVLQPEQVQTLLDEIEFIGSLIQDAALLEQLEQLRQVAYAVTRRSRPAELIIQGP